MKSIWSREVIYNLFPIFHVSWGVYILSPQKVRRGSWHRSNIYVIFVGFTHILSKNISMNGIHFLWGGQVKRLLGKFCLLLFPIANPHSCQYLNPINFPCVSVELWFPLGKLGQITVDNVFIIELKIAAFNWSLLHTSLIKEVKGLIN